MIFLLLPRGHGYLPSDKYTPGPEILQHGQPIARTCDLYEDALFSTEVRRAATTTRARGSDVVNV